MTRFIMSFLVAACTLTGCKTSEPAVALPASYEITVGRGGGMTGMYTYYTFSKSGDVTQAEELNAKGEKVKSVEASVVSGFMTRATKNQYKDLEINDPGNFSNYLQIKTGDEIKLFVWNGNTTIPEWLEKLHADMWSLAE